MTKDELETAWKAQGVTIMELRAEVERLRGALTCIAKGEVIEAPHVQAVAKQALAQQGESDEQLSLQILHLHLCGCHLYWCSHFSTLATEMTKTTETGSGYVNTIAEVKQPLIDERIAADAVIKEKDEAIQFWRDLCAEAAIDAMKLRAALRTARHALLDNATAIAEIDGVLR